MKGEGLVLRFYLHVPISVLKATNEIPLTGTAERAFHFGAVLTKNE